MSQEINLLNEVLRPQRDWLAFQPVVMAAGGVSLLVLCLFAYARMEMASATRTQAAAAEQLANVQRELQDLQVALGVRKSDPALAQMATQLAAAVKQRSEVLQLATGMATDAGSVTDIMRGFSRQRVEGVWLTGFNAGPGGLDMRGRLLDPNLLPTYIRRLNAEPSFRGRQFAALDMQGVVPQPPVAGQATAPVPVAPAPVQAGPTRYTEFALRASAVSASGVKE